MRLRKAAIALLATRLACQCFAQTKPPTETAQPKPPAETFYSQAQHAILRLENTETNLITKLITYHSGTGFFVHTEKQNWYVITAAHVAGEAFSYVVKVPILLDNGNVVDARIVLPPDKWEFHPDVGDSEHFGTDVAAMKIRTFGGGLKSFVYCPTKCEEGGYNQLDTDAEPPDVVMTFGFPLLPGMVVFSRPLGRQGMVAFVDAQTDAISVEHKWFDRHGFILDMPTITGGASGSPVIKLPVFGRLTLVGLISATNTNLGGGYAVAEPVSRIRELLDRLEDQNIPVVDPWCLATQEEAKKITNNTIPVCK